MQIKRPTIPKAARVRVKVLRAELEHHNRLYYVDARPAITDGEYDALFRELQDLERQYPDLATSDSPTQKVGARMTRGAKKMRAGTREPRERSAREVVHAIPLLSLDNTYSPDELRAFDERVRVTVSVCVNACLGSIDLVEPLLSGQTVEFS